MVLGPNFGLTVPSILGNGSTEKLKVKEHSTILTVTYLWENFKMIKQTEVGNTSTKMLKLMKASGLKTCNMEMVEKTCLTVAHSKDFSKKDAKMATEFTSGPTTLCTKECGKVVKSTVEAFMCGLMVENTKGSGVKTNSMEKEPTNGPMVECIQANI